MEPIVSVPLPSRKASLDILLLHYPIAIGIASFSHYVDIINLSSISKGVRQSMFSTLSHPKYESQIHGLRQSALKYTCGKLMEGGPEATRCVGCNVQICQPLRAPMFDSQGPTPQSSGCCVVREIPSWIPHNLLCHAYCDTCVRLRPICVCPSSEEELDNEGPRALCLSCANRPVELLNYAVTVMIDKQMMWREVRCNLCYQQGYVGDAWRWICRYCWGQCERRTYGHKTRVFTQADHDEKDWRKKKQWCARCKKAQCPYE